MLTTESFAAIDPNSSRRNVLIVGGGPSGLATALMLALRGWTNITVLEKRPAADYYEPDKSFNYLIDGRGQKMTDFLGLTQWQPKNFESASGRSQAENSLLGITSSLCEVARPGNQTQLA
jgi:2-polyprenyl-6-methoxyphenol hydroxylase-like FAD-dependent oxidoreductase